MRKLVVGITIASLMGCSMGHRDPVEVKQALNESINQANSRALEEIPSSVEADLMPNLDSNVSSDNGTSKRFRIQANAVEARSFFASLVKGTEYSVAIHPAVQGNITVNLSDVTLDEVLSVVQNMYGYDVMKSGKVIQVYPAGMRTVTIPVDYLQFKRSGRSLTSIVTGSVTSAGTSNSGGSSDSSDSSDSNNSNNGNDSSTTSTGGTRIETITESDFWPMLQQAVANLIGSGKGQSVVVTPQAGVISVRAFPDDIREVREFLGVSQERMQRQVILEAKILEVTLSDGYQQGINWSNLSASIGNSGSIIVNRPASALPPLDAIGTLLGGQTNVTISDGNFEAVLNFMSTQGDLNVLSSPRITAANNQKSVIKVGTDQYFVTELSSNAGNGENSNAVPEVELTPFFSGISLDVTPQIDNKGNVFLHVHPAVIEVTEEVKQLNLGGDFQNIQLPLAKSSIRESDSVIRAKDGDVVVIGGLMKQQNVEQVSKVPFLGDVPALGHLFRNTSNVTQKTELVILLKPTVVGVNSWQKELERSRDLLQEWFPDAQ
ncbi:pilus (MSHA type) biogenesis protein MshL [Vibrio parahaemolyticus]|uniref:pilus (MSHA type) biogenesis protein MshL n=1 Tax=Vibrio parahaemolyticus TaxID=670 RepID=UPI00046EBBB0|nr:pilus (MSHA type) biogenesis protein MshL [Vibrio parahaemolyticus]EJG0767052.1 pilus (MSHA type) biogenesis protein MshL [Vibrio parahaemolyticus O5:K30]EHK6027395.1 pilus (MSHA type) biogenesis protein MshL [Vibrio parahaemolyticus]EHK9073250.1 pilus (MSHA type) biogenesis protein MshL [Vibrio parahaemolyticus]EIE9608635.1 pilus (MSHA type) biogenesis protein MshL [Vibrio parahaemolyticus]EIO4096768.1 pilus (MSHA type) biogenesis protein MshL [Vibrio parahaemolyticus]